MGICSVGANIKPGYVLTAPSEFDSDSTEQICLTLHNIKTNGNILVSLVSRPERKLIGQINQNIKNGLGRCFELKLDPTAAKTAGLYLNGTFNEENYTFSNFQDVNIRQKVDITLVQTDKPIYKPGQIVKFRVLHVTALFKPSYNKIKSVSVENPSQVRLSQWIFPPSENGITDLSFPLSDEPQLGIWTINVKDSSNKTIKQTFKVEEYVLPKFSVQIIPPPVVLATTNEISWKVCAHYTYGEPVIGKIKANITRTSPSTWINQIETVDVVEKDFHECLTMTANKTELKFNNWDLNSLKILNFNAEVTEAGTDTVMSAHEKREIQKIPLKLSIVSKKYFKANLQYNGKVKTENTGGGAAANEALNIQCKVYDGKGDIEASITIDVVTDHRGMATFIIPPQNTTVEKLQFEVKATNYPSGKYLFGQYEYFSSSLSNSYIIQPILFETLKKFAIDVTLTSVENSSQQIHYQVMARNNIVAQKSVLVEQPETSETFSVKIPIKVEPQFSPKISIVVYYIREDGEIVSDSETFDVEECFKNNIEMKFEDETVLPGAIATLNVSADVNSLCGIGFTDKSVLLLSEQQFNRNRVFSILKENPSNKPISRPEQKCQPNDREGFYRINTNQLGSISAFDDNGILTMTDLKLNGSLCKYLSWRYDYHYSLPYFERGFSFNDEIIPMSANFHVYSPAGRELPGIRGPPGMIGRVNSPVLDLDSSPSTDNIALPAVEIRDHFPETWLWQLVNLGDKSQSSIQQEIPHSITEWTGSSFCVSSETGLGMSFPVSIKAFQPFFLSVTTPYSVKNDETIPLIVSIFNYLSSCFPLVITLEPSGSFEIISNSTDVTTCICGSKSFTHKYLIRPIEIGSVNVTVKAHSIPRTDSNSTDTICLNQSEVANVIAYDAITKSLLVKPQGFPQEKSQSIWICRKDETEETTVLEYLLELPHDTINKSARATLTFTGDLMGPTLSGLESLVRLPIGCGEQNMVLFVPNIHVFHYLNESKQLTESMSQTIISHLKQGYQRELNYKHYDGSYSAFGSSDSEGSIWLTAFVLKSFAKASSIVFIEPEELNSCIKFITANQLTNGCFKTTGRLVHKSMQGGIGQSKSSNALTLYITIALLEAGYSVDSKVISQSLNCIEEDDNPNVYQLAMKAYALVLANKTDKAKIVIEKLEKQVIKKGNTAYWSNSQIQSHSNDIETTSYTLLAMVTLNLSKHKELCLQVVRWLTMQRNGYGGFDSTQDTVLALQALSTYVSGLSKTKLNLTIELLANDLQDRIYVNDDNRLLTQIKSIPALPNAIDVEISGIGCVLVQSLLKYNIIGSNASNIFSLDVSVAPYNLKTFSTKEQSIEICTSYNAADGHSNMAIVEVQMVTGYEVDKAHLETIKNPVNKLKRWEVNPDGAVELYFDELTKQLNCFNVIINEKMEVENLKPAAVKVYDYYRPEQSFSMEYTAIPKQQMPIAQKSSQPEGRILNDELQNDSPKIACPICKNYIDNGLKMELCSAETVLMVRVRNATKSLHLRMNFKNSTFIEKLVNYKLDASCPKCSPLSKEHKLTTPSVNGNIYGGGRVHINCACSSECLVLFCHTVQYQNAQHFNWMFVGVGGVAMMDQLTIKFIQVTFFKAKTRIGL
ncbi:C3 and PZP-like, alpha-2-macroglobulin domain containing 8 [Chamberlinius hualienensis]